MHIAVVFGLSFFKKFDYKKNLFEVTRLLWGLFHENIIKKKTTSIIYFKFKMLIFLDQEK